MTDLQIIERPSPNHDARPAGQAIDLLLLHYTGMPTGEAALERLYDPAARVSVHYLVEAAGRIFQLVSQSLRAWPAGLACWPGVPAINELSPSLEIIHPRTDFPD